MSVLPMSSAQKRGCASASIRRVLPGAIIACLCVCTLGATEDSGAGWTGNVHLGLGYKAVNGDDWPSGSDQGGFALGVDLGRRTWPVLLTIEMLTAAGVDDVGGQDVLSITSECAIGVKKQWALATDRWRPYVAGGVTVVSAAIWRERVGERNAYDTVSDETIGGWAAAGVHWMLTRRFSLGLEARFSHAEVTIEGRDRDAGGASLGLITGIHW